MLNRRLGHEDIMLFALDNTLASELASVLTFERRAFRSAPFDPTAEGVRVRVAWTVGHHYHARYLMTNEMVLHTSVGFFLENRLRR